MEEVKVKCMNCGHVQKCCAPPCEKCQGMVLETLPKK